MRTLAITLVVASHALLFFPGSRGLTGVGLLAGFLGVELFFVLSGFLIGGILLRDFERDASVPALRRFWFRRWFRTLPNYFLFLLLNVLLVRHLGGKLPNPLPYIFFLQNLTGPPPAFFVDSWSLAVEEWFYLLLPVAVLAVLKGTRLPLRRAVLWVLVVGVAAVTAARLSLVVAEQPNWLRNVRMTVVLRLDACVFGVLGAWLRHFHRESWEKCARVGVIGGLIVLAAVLAWTISPGADPVLFKTFSFTLASVGTLLLLPALSAWRRTEGSIARVIRNVSIWSYSLYLVNFPVHTLVSHYFLRADSGSGFRLLLSACFVTLSVILSALNYRFFERWTVAIRDRRGGVECGERGSVSQPAGRRCSGSA